MKNQKIYFSTFLLLSHLSTFRLFEIKIYPFLRFDFSTFRLFVFRLFEIKNKPLLAFRLFDFRNSKRNLSTFRLFVFRLFEIEFTYFPPGTLQRVFPTQLVPPCLPIVSLFPLSPSLSPCLSLSLSPNLSPILFPSLSLSLSLFLFPFVAGGFILHFSWNSVLLTVLNALSCVWPCSSKHFLNPPTVWGLRWCNFFQGEFIANQTARHHAGKYLSSHKLGGGKRSANKGQSFCRV